MMALDEHGNPRGGIRTTYVDVPTAKYVIRPAASTPVIRQRRAYIATGGQKAANLMCGLSTAQIAFAPAKLKELYKNKQGYVKAVEKRLTELEKAGWSLPLYREMILARRGESELLRRGQTRSRNFHFFCSSSSRTFSSSSSSRLFVQ